MKKLTVLIAIILIAGLLTGCWLLPEEPEEEKIITITWFEDAIRYHPDGTEHSRWYNDLLGPATLIQDNGGWYFANTSEYFNIYVCPDTEGSIIIDETGLLTGYATYTLYELPTENSFVGQVEIIVYGESDTGTMVGTYTQWKYAFGTEEAVMAKYPKAVKCEGIKGKWYVQYTDYIAYPR